MNTLVALSSDLGDKFIFGGKVALIGIVVVFVLLIILVLILQIFQVMYKTKFDTKLEDGVNNCKAKLKGKLKIKHKKKSTDVKGAEIVPQITLDASVDYNQTVAAIMGALAVVLQEEGADNPDAQFIVRKIKKLEFRR